jgi:hypothetical protein
MDALPPVSSDKLTILLIAGVIFALAGLWLMMRPKKVAQSGEGEETTSGAKLELFGLKFQSSSAGLLVFLVGAAFMAGGTLLPERQVSVIDGWKFAEGSDDPQQKSPDADASESATNEVEPNDASVEANVLSVGSVLSGKVEGSDEDFYVVELPEGFTGTFAVNIRGHAKFKVFDDLMSPARTSNVFQANTPFEEEAPGSKYYVMVWTHDRMEKAYELTAAVRTH